MRKKKQQQGPKGPAPWVLTYGDCMTLILCFFVLLFSFSTMDVVKFQRMIDAFQGAFGVLDGGEPISQGQLKKAKNVKDNQKMADDRNDQQQEDIESEEQKKKAEMKRLRRELAQIARQLEQVSLKDAQGNEIRDKLGRETKIDFQVLPEPRGWVIRIQDRALFDSGKAEINKYNTVILDKISDLLKDYDYPIAIEGHTDNQPIGSELKKKFETNWELSAARAVNVLRYFVEEQDFPPDKISAAGYGEFRPVAPNTRPDGTPDIAGRTKNRRVDIVILGVIDSNQ